MTSLKSQLSDFQALAAKEGYHEATKGLGQQVDAIQKLVDSYMKRSSAQEQHYKATDADIKELGSWFTQNQQAISKICQSVNALCADIEGMTVTVKVDKAAPQILGKEFEKVIGMSTADFLQKINLTNLNQALNTHVSQAQEASASAQLYASWVNRGLTVFRGSLLLIASWLVLTVITITSAVASLFLPGALKGIAFLIVAFYLIIIFLSWKHRNDLIDGILKQVKEE